MTEAQKQLFEYFDADVHDRLKIKSDHAKDALDRVGERFWKLAHWGLDGSASFNEPNLEFDLPDPPEPGIPEGRYRLISAARSDEDYAATEAHLLRLSSPLGEWLTRTAKGQTLPTSKIRFDITGHPRKVSMLDPLVGRRGWIRLDLLTLDSDEREEFLLLTAIDDAGQNIDQEIIQRLMDVTGTPVEDTTTPADTAARLDADADQLTRATLNKASQAGDERFKQVQKQVDAWADDKIHAAEQVLDTIRRELRGARRRAEVAETVAAQQEAQAAIAQLEAKRRRARRQIEDTEDEVEAERLKLLAQLRARSQRSHDRKTLFTICFETK
jgi:hypothetical protein